MLKAALPALFLSVTLSTPLLAQAPANPPANPVDVATDEAVRREFFRKELDQKLADAQAAQKKGSHFETARLYDECLDLVKKIGTGVEAQEQAALAGYIPARLELAMQAERDGDFAGAERHLALVLKRAPKNEAALKYQIEESERRARVAGRMPSQETLSRLPDFA